MKRSAKNKTILILATLALIVVGVAAYIKATQPGYTPSSSADTEIHAGPNTDTSPAPTTTPQPNPSRPTSSTLAQPIGPINNTSSVSLSGPTGMESVCRSLAGASCYIEATRDTQTIKVSDTKVIGSTTASDGVIFNWNAKQLSLGQWSIRAVASKDGQSAKSNPQLLTVSP